MSKSKKRTPFISLYFPNPKRKKNWFESIFFDVSKGLVDASASHHLLDLIVRDLQKDQTIEPAVKSKLQMSYNAYHIKTKNVPVARKTRCVGTYERGADGEPVKPKRSDRINQAYCLYIPKKLEMIRDLLQSKPNISAYVWRLFVAEHRNLFSPTQQQWLDETYPANPHPSHRAA